MSVVFVDYLFGSDSNSGTYNSPLKTITAATLVPGCTGVNVYESVGINNLTNNFTIPTLTSSVAQFAIYPFNSPPPYPFGPYQNSRLQNYPDPLYGNSPRPPNVNYMHPFLIKSLETQGASTNTNWVSNATSVDVNPTGVSKADQYSSTGYGTIVTIASGFATGVAAHTANFGDITNRNTITYFDSKRSPNYYSVDLTQISLHLYSDTYIPPNSLMVSLIAGEAYGSPINSYTIDVPLYAGTWNTLSHDFATPLTSTSGGLSLTVLQKLASSTVNITIDNVIACNSLTLNTVVNLNANIPGYSPPFKVTQPKSVGWCLKSLFGLSNVNSEPITDPTYYYEGTFQLDQAPNSLTFQGRGFYASPNAVREGKYGNVCPATISSFISTYMTYPASSIGQTVQTIASSFSGLVQGGFGRGASSYSFNGTYSVFDGINGNGVGLQVLASSVQIANLGFVRYDTGISDQGLGNNTYFGNFTNGNTTYGMVINSPNNSFQQLPVNTGLGTPLTAHIAVQNGLDNIYVQSGDNNNLCPPEVIPTYSVGLSLASSGLMSDDPDWSPYGYFAPTTAIDVSSAGRHGLNFAPGTSTFSSNIIANNCGGNGINLDCDVAELQYINANGNVNSGIKLNSPNASIIRTAILTGNGNTGLEITQGTDHLILVPYCSGNGPIGQGPAIIGSQSYGSSCLYYPIINESTQIKTTGLNSISSQTQGDRLNNWVPNNHYTQSSLNNITADNSFVYNPGPNKVSWRMTIGALNNNSFRPVQIKLPPVANIFAQTIAVTAWVYRQNTGQTLRMRVPKGYILGPTTDQIVYSQQVGQWEQLYMTFTVTEGGTFPVWFEAWGSLGSCWIDDMSLGTL